MIEYSSPSGSIGEYIYFYIFYLISITLSFSNQSAENKVLNIESAYTLFQNGRHFSILLFPCTVALMASLSNVKFKRIFNLERGHKDQFAWKQENTKMAAILE